MLVDWGLLITLGLSEDSPSLGGGDSSSMRGIVGLECLVPAGTEEGEKYHGFVSSVVRKERALVNNVFFLTCQIGRSTGVERPAREEDLERLTGRPGRPMTAK